MKVEMTEAKVVNDMGVVATVEPEPGEYHGWVLREVLFDNGEPVGHREPVQEPVAYSVGRTLHWHQGKGVSDAQLFAAPLQRKPLSGVAIYGLFVRSGLGAYHQKDFVVQTEYDRCIERFARAVERAHGIV